MYTFPEYVPVSIQIYRITPCSASLSSSAHLCTCMLCSAYTCVRTCIGAVRDPTCMLCSAYTCVRTCIAAAPEYGIPRACCAVPTHVCGPASVQYGINLEQVLSFMYRDCNNCWAPYTVTYCNNCWALYTLTVIIVGTHIP